MTPDTKQVEPLTERWTKVWMAYNERSWPRAYDALGALEHLTLEWERALQQRDAQLLVMREALELLLEWAEEFDGYDKGVADPVTQQARDAISSTSQLASEVKERIERPLREQLLEAKASGVIEGQAMGRREAAEEVTRLNQEVERLSKRVADLEAR